MFEVLLIKSRISSSTRKLCLRDFDDFIFIISLLGWSEGLFHQQQRLLFPKQPVLATFVILYLGWEHHTFASYAAFTITFYYIFSVFIKCLKCIIS